MVVAKLFLWLTLFVLKLVQKTTPVKSSNNAKKTAGESSSESESEVSSEESNEEPASNTLQVRIKLNN